MALLQSKIMRYSKYPADKIAAGLGCFHMPKQRQKDLLNNLFSVMCGQAECHDVNEQPMTMLIEECHYIALQLRDLFWRTGPVMHQ